MLRSVTLDSTYQVLGLDPWYTTTVVTARRAFEQACERSVACAGAAGGGSAWARISALARRLARAPVSGETTTADGTRGRLTVTVLTLVNLVNNAGFDSVVYQDLDAAGRALLRHRDAAPLLRLAALSLGFDDSNEPLPGFSDGLYFAVACTDYVQLFDRSAAPRTRARQYRDALRSEPPRTFAPFSLTQWTSMDQYTEAYSACLRWPKPVRLVPADHQAAAAGARQPAGPDPVREPGLTDPAAARRDPGGAADGALGPAGDAGQPDSRHRAGQQCRLRDVDLPALHRRAWPAGHRRHLLRQPGEPGAHGGQLSAPAAQPPGPPPRCLATRPAARPCRRPRSRWRALATRSAAGRC